MSFTDNVTEEHNDVTNASVNGAMNTSSDITSRPNKRVRHAHGSSTGQNLSASERANEASLSRFSSVTGTSPTESSLMMNPPMAEDITLLQKYLTSTTAGCSLTSKPYSTISTGPGGSPVVYLTLPKRRRGLKSAIDPGRTQKEIIEQVLSPHTSEIRKAFFDHLHPCFPVLDEQTFSDMWREDNERISSTLICDLYASALQVWDRSTVLCHQTRPDPHFIWNQAVTALQDDFMAPTISTVHAAVLDLLGRPVIGVTGNIVNAGRVVTLAQSLGLHRDPTSWRATDHEKGVRINLWWGVLIHDYWSSIGHGTPPTVNPRYFDVPIPSCTNAGISNAPVRIRERSTFVQLCKLSQILGDILPLVYSLEEATEEIESKIRKVKCALEDWVFQLPDYLQPSYATPFVTNGGSNLWFAYLSVKVLLYRLSFKTVLGETNGAPKARQYQLVLLRNSASEAIDFVTSLTEAQLQEFWMPYTSYLLVTAATILLRCTIECSHIDTKKKCVTKLVAFRDRLRLAKDFSHWDLAEFCLERCDEPIQKFADAFGIPPERTTAVPPAIQLTESASDEAIQPVMDPLTMADLFLPIDSLDYPWETLWDSMEGPWPIQI